MRARQFQPSRRAIHDRTVVIGVRRYLPDDILFRPKQGFVTPIAKWLRGPLAGAARDIARSSAIARLGWFDLARIDEIAQAHIAGKRDSSRLLWQMMMLDKSLIRLGISA